MVFKYQKNIPDVYIDQLSYYLFYKFTAYNYIEKNHLVIVLLFYNFILLNLSIYISLLLINHLTYIYF